MQNNWAKLKQLLPSTQEQIYLRDFTTLQIGGQVTAFLNAKSNIELAEAITVAKQLNLPFLVIGGGSNLLVSDAKIDKFIIKNEVNSIIKEGNLVKVSGGTNLQNLVDYTIEQSYGGIHKMTGIPGTVAGAVYGNAGAYGQTISDNLTKVICFDPNKLESVILTRDQCGFSYRDSEFKNNGLIILEIYFDFPKQSSKTLRQESAEVLNLRLAKYKPGIKCPGSFFKNVLSETIPVNVKSKIPDYKDTYGKIPAWVFLNEVGAQGQRLGNIEIASFHSNLFVNLGEGKADDFWKLAKIYYQKVKDKFGIELEPEVQLIDLPPFS